MCTVCGCGSGETRIESAEKSNGKSRSAGGLFLTNAHVHAADQAHEHVHADGTRHSHGHAHSHPHDHDHAHADATGADAHEYHRHDLGLIDYGQGPARAHAPGLTQARMVQIEQDILGKNNAYAAANRAFLDQRGILALNLVSSPGSGKTTLLVKLIERLHGRLAVAVIEGDQQTSNDAERVRATGAPAIQVNTGKGCHLDAHMVGHAIEHLAPKDGSVLFIENVGNLVCPAAFDLGEAHKVVILSVTEGEDKPLKYPDMFAAAGLMVLSKTDLLPHLDFDVGAAIANARKVNPSIKVLPVSARTGDGLDSLAQWIMAARTMSFPAHPAPAAAALVQGG